MPTQTLGIPPNAAATASDDRHLILDRVNSRGDQFAKILEDGTEDAAREGDGAGHFVHDGRHFSQ